LLSSGFLAGLVRLPVSGRGRPGEKAVRGGLDANRLSRHDRELASIFGTAAPTRREMIAARLLAPAVDMVQTLVVPDFLRLAGQARNCVLVTVLTGRNMSLGTRIAW